MNILVIAAHPDDELLGVGGTILKKIEQGHKVYLCILTVAHTPEWSEKIIKIKRKEAEEVSKRLGIKKTYFCYFPTVKLDTLPIKEIIKKLKNIIKKVNPSEIYTNHKGDANQDHKIAFEATIVATKNSSNIKRLLAYEALSSTDVVTSVKEDAFLPNVFEDISKTINKKLELLKIYKTEMKKFPHPRNLKTVEALATLRGSQSNFKAAEAFMLIKEVNK